MDSEEFMKLIDTLPTIEPKTPISVYEAINVQEFNEFVKRYKLLPNYDLLLHENNKFAYKWNELIKRLSSKFNETQETFYLDVIKIMEEIDKSCKEINRYVKD